jgi:spore germination cell wall hydrolase CwlJ-like protein
MTVRFGWTRALVATVVLNTSAFAEVRVSTAGDPAGWITGSITGRMTAVPGSGRVAVGQEAAARPAVQYDAGWLAGLPMATGDEQWQCLTEALYFEARGETVRGQFAVAEVILNRVDSPLYPRSVCGVVRQGGHGGCQFSFTCDRNSDAMREKDAYREAGKIARLMLDGAARALTDGATHFHTRGVNPGWSRQFAKTASIGAHVFYRQPGA